MIMGERVSIIGHEDIWAKNQTGFFNTYEPAFGNQPG